MAIYIRGSTEQQNLQKIWHSTDIDVITEPFLIIMTLTSKSELSFLCFDLVFHHFGDDCHDPLVICSLNDLELNK